MNLYNSSIRCTSAALPLTFYRFSSIKFDSYHVSFLHFCFAFILFCEIKFSKLTLAESWPKLRWTRSYLLSTILVLFASSPYNWPVSSCYFRLISCQKFLLKFYLTSLAWKFHGSSFEKKLVKIKKGLVKSECEIRHTS